MSPFDLIAWALAGGAALLILGLALAIVLAVLAAMKREADS